MNQNLQFDTATEEVKHCNTGFPHNVSHRKIS